jgi:hypothetical protein
MTPTPAPTRVVVSVAMLVGIVAVAGFMSIRFAPGVSSPRVVLPSPIAVDYGPPPAGAPLLYVRDPNHAGWLIGFDWTGKPRGTVKIALPIDPYGTFGQSPDGSTFGYAPNGKGGYQQFFDRLGSPLPSQDSALGYEDEVWADSGPQLCTLVASSGGQWNLGLRLPGQAPPRVSVVALDPSIVRSGIIDVSFAACTPSIDRAILERSYYGIQTDLWVVRITDGGILSHRTYPANQLVNVTASHDGALIAENSGKSSAQLALAAPSTIIRRVSDMSVVATLDPSMGVVGFNSDDSLALVSTTPWASGVATHLALIDVRTGGVLWRYDGTQELSSFLAQPDGRDFVVLLKDSPLVDIIFVHADGTATQIPGRYGAI